MLKKMLHKLKIDYLVGRFVGFGFQHVLKRDPYLYKHLRENYESQFLNELYEQIGHLGENSYMRGFAHLSHPKGLMLGNNVQIGKGAHIESRGGIIIHDNVVIGDNVTLKTVRKKLDGRGIPFSPENILESIVISSGVSIGLNVNILPGVRIGEGAVIGTGVTVEHDVPAFSVVSNPNNHVVNNKQTNNYNDSMRNKIYVDYKNKTLNASQIKSFKVPLSSPSVQPFFILSTGRAGSTTIAKILNNHPDIECLHEPKLHLVRISTELLHGKISKEQALKELKTLFLDFSTTNRKFYGESDQKLSNLVPLIREILPNAKFIWMLRNPVDSINSSWSRGWFDDIELGYSTTPRENYSLYRDIYSDFRPHADKAGDLTAREWKDMSSFARNCWYWTYWNKVIEQSLNSLPREQALKVKLEQLDNSFDRITTFLGLPDSRLNNQIANKAEQKYKLKDASDWDIKMKQDFDSIVDTTIYTRDSI